MRKKNYKGRCEKRKLTKCDGICKTYDELQYVYANLINASNDVKSFQVNVYLEGLVMKRYDDTMVNAQLMTCDRKTVLCIFKDVKVIRDNLYINDSFLMDCIEDGEYLIKIMIDNHFFFRSIRICSVGASDNQRYSKEDPILVESNEKKHREGEFLCRKK